MIEPLLWTVMCACALAMCWSKMRSQKPLASIVFAGFGLVFASSGWHAFGALLQAMETYSAGLEPEPFRVSLLVSGPLAYVLGKPHAAALLGALPWTH